VKGGRLGSSAQRTPKSSSWEAPVAALLGKLPPVPRTLQESLAIRLEGGYGGLHRLLEFRGKTTWHPADRQRERGDGGPADFTWLASVCLRAEAAKLERP